MTGESALISRRGTYAGLFFVALSTLMYEILLTRIFSVTMWYHYSFMAISIAMFGMTVGALLVYLLPRRFTAESAKRHMASSSLLFSMTIVVCFLIHLRIPFTTEGDSVAWPWLALTYTVISIPFVFSGICICLSLTKFPRQVSKLYAADLAGAAAGCVLVIYAVNLTDGPTAVFLCALAAAAGAALFASDRGSGIVKGASLIVCILTTAFVAVNSVFVAKQSPLLRVTWVKGAKEPPGLYEKWNSFSRIRVWGDKQTPKTPFGWGMSPNTPAMKVRRLDMNIDAGAYTPITHFDGDIDKLEYLKYDVTNIAHYLRPEADVLVVGAGGGRDVLSALAFDQSSVVAVEINGDIIEAVNERFGDFTGHLDRRPEVTFVNDEARSFVAGGDDKYDLIQISLIDTWAATAAGAFVLAENSLYTVEAWEIFLERLNPNGILTVSRWYLRDGPAEMYRLTSLANASLRELGVGDPRGNIVVVRSLWWGRARNQPVGVGTILVSPDPFSEGDLNAIWRVCKDLQFEIVLSPRGAFGSAFTKIAEGKDPETVVAGFPIDISAPTDDRPFFFNMLRLRDMFKKGLSEKAAIRFNLKAVSLLGALIGIVLGLTLLCIVLPLLSTARRETLKGTFPFFMFFAAIGLGFMFVEISQLQRLIVFLGHPTYGLSVVLFSLLLSSGLGSFLTKRVGDGGIARPGAVRLILLLCVLGLFGAVTPAAVQALQEQSTPARIAAAACMLCPLGLFMGMAFPLGLKLASARSESVTPWLWGINGATSVCASVLAIAIALSMGISATFWGGFVCYGAALAAFLWAGNVRPEP
jgi:hypothetical protein